MYLKWITFSAGTILLIIRIHFQLCSGKPFSPDYGPNKNTGDFGGVPPYFLTRLMFIAL